MVTCASRITAGAPPRRKTVLDIRISFLDFRAESYLQLHRQRRLSRVRS